MTRLGRAFGPGTLKRVDRGGGHWLWTLDYRDGTGRRVRASLSADKRVAERLRADLINKRDLEMAGLGAVEGQSMLLSELRDLYLGDLDVRVGAKQQRSIKDALARVLGALRATRVRDVRVIDVLRYRAERLKGGASHRTANVDTGALRSMLNWGVAAQLIAENPLGALKPLPMGERNMVHVRRALSDAEITAFLAAADDDDRDVAAYVAAERSIATGLKGEGYARKRRSVRVPQRLLWQALLETGARWSELTSTTWLDLDVQRRALTLRAATTKSGRTRIIPLRAELVQELLELRRIHRRARRRVVQGGDRIFLSPDGADLAVSTTAARILFRRVLERAGIDRVDQRGRVLDIHGLRHSAASRMARNGVPLVVAQKVLGHASPDMTARVYTHLEVDDLREAVEFGPAKPRIVSRGSGKLEQSA